MLIIKAKVMFMKIIATDYDGTLNHNGIGEEKKAAISKWRKAGNLFGIVSGRGLRSLLREIKDIGFEYDFLICNNGSVIYDKDLNIIKESRCNGAITKPLIEDLFKWGCPFANIDKDVSIMIRAHDETCGDNEIHIEKLPVITYFNQINTMLESEEEAACVVLKINELYGHMLTPLQNGKCIDITPFGVDKAKGIYSLLEAVNCSFSDVIAVGDNINDEAMIKEFRSYAMSNGVQYIKDIANDITDGITRLIEKELALTE